jgi:hypothetical protein
MSRDQTSQARHRPNSLVTVVRWASVLPAAIVAVYVGKLIINVFLPWGLRAIIQPVPVAVLDVARALYSPVAFTWGGVKVAPSRKRSTGYFLVAAWFAFYAGAFVFSYAVHGGEIEPIAGLRGWLFVVFNVLAALGGMFSALLCTPSWADDDGRADTATGWNPESPSNHSEPERVSTRSAETTCDVGDALSRLIAGRASFAGTWRRRSPPGSRIVFFFADDSRITVASDGGFIHVTEEKPGDLEEQGFVFEGAHGSAGEPSPELRSLFLRLWTKASTDGQYNKAEWQELGRYLGVS